MLVFTYKYSIFFYTSGGIFKYSGLSVSVKYILFVVLVYLSKLVSKSGFFLSRSGLRIFKQNRENPDEIGLVGQSGDEISEGEVEGEKKGLPISLSLLLFPRNT